MIMFFATLGFLLIAWFVVGVIAFTYSRIYIAPGAPLGAKIQTALWAGIMFPWIMITCGKWPSEIIGAICPAEPDEAEKERFNDWMKANCQCGKCKARRGE